MCREAASEYSLGPLAPGMLFAIDLIVMISSLAAKRRRNRFMSSTLTNLLYHIVFSTKNREPIITAPIRADLYQYMGGIIRGEGGILLEIGGIPDHVHLVTKFKTEPSVATMIKIVKSKS